MLSIIISILLGIAAGLSLRDKALARKLPFTMRPLVLILLFVMGLHLGADRAILSRLATFGWSAAVIAVCSVAGSIALACLYQFIPRRTRRQPS